jgi:hypothetical protein
MFYLTLILVSANPLAAHLLFVRQVISVEAATQKAVSINTNKPTLELQ